MAKIKVRRLAGARRARSECSRGTNTLTSPDDGFSVPTAATTNNGSSNSTKPKAKPVAAISRAAPSSMVRKA